MPATAKSTKGSPMTVTLPIHHIDHDAFWHDPYPDLKMLRHISPIALVPELAAISITRRDDIFKYEKRLMFSRLINPMA